MSEELSRMWSPPLAWGISKPGLTAEDSWNSHHVSSRVEDAADRGRGCWMEEQPTLVTIDHVLSAAAAPPVP
jgi:hypothetical protein